MVLTATGVLMGCTRSRNSGPQREAKSFFDEIERGDVAAAKEMIAKEPSLLKETDQHGFTPLMRAVSSMERSRELVQALIQAGADVNARTGEDYTALHMVVDVNGPTGHGEIPSQLVGLLVDAGAHLEIRQHWGWTPLMRAVLEGTADELRALVDAGGELNKRFPDHTLPEFLAGRTTLMAAIGFPENTRILVDAGADVLATDDHGDNVLEYAERRLADARGRDAASRASLRDEFSKLFDEIVDEMVRDGLASDTEREKLREDMLGRVLEHDYCKVVEECIEIIKEAMDRTR